MKKVLLILMALLISMSMLLTACHNAPENLEDSEGLEYASLHDGTCYLKGIGKCTDTDVVIPAISPDGDSVIFIQQKAFAGCTNLKSVTIPRSVVAIDLGAFEGCTGLKSMTIPSSVIMIGKSAFKGCTGLTSMIIPKSVTSIGADAFSGCTKLADVYFTGTEKEWKAMLIESGNEALTNATVHYNYVSK